MIKLLKTDYEKGIDKLVNVWTNALPIVGKIFESQALTESRMTHTAYEKFYFNQTLMLFWREPHGCVLIIQLSG